MNRQMDSSWDFAEADTKYHTHGVHSYPAMMIPQVAKRIISENSKKAKVGLDPFCGSGSALLEFKLAGIDCYGLDINPLAALISRVKTTPISPHALEKAWEKLKTEIGEKTFEPVKKTPNFFNIDFWFKKQAIVRLTIIKNAIDRIENKAVRDFFLACFSEAVRKSSNTRGGEFKLFRMPEDKLKAHNPDPFLFFSNAFKRNLQGMRSFYETCKTKRTGKVKVLLGDITEKIKIPPASVDLLVTSPPYGDSRTTVAYGQYSRLSLQWLGFPDEAVKQMDKRMLGGKPAPSLDFDFESPTLEKTIKPIAKVDEQRAKDVVSFFIDFQKGAREINKVMKKKSTICLVVGNRTVKGVWIPSDKIMAEIFEEFGYTHEKTTVRNIPSKRMPKINSPTNVVGETLSTMNKENIVILKR